METALLGTIASYVAIGSGVATAGLGIVQGGRASRAASLEREQYEDQARTAQLAADQEEIIKRKRLEAVLAQNDALRGARGLSLDTGGDRALRASNIADAEDDIAVGRLNRSAQASAAKFGAMRASMSETSSLFSGAGAFVSGLGSAATGALKYANIGGSSGFDSSGNPTRR